jgi:two-component system chemotaxis sensor kinase CheA
MGLDPELLKQLVVVFETELNEHLQTITDGLLKLEKGPLPAENDQETVQSIFRAAHSIKGASRSLGINDVGEIAHHIESLFSAIQKKTLAVNPATINLCLEAVDKMRTAMRFFLDTGKENASTPPTETAATTVTPKPESSSSITQPATKPSDMVRVDLKNIARISALLEKIQANKISIDDHFIELTKLSTKAKEFSDAWKQILSFIKTHFEINKSDALQKMYYNSSDIFNEIENGIFHLQRNLRSQINDFVITTGALQDEVRMLRLVPASHLFCTLPRYVRDLAQELNKKVELEITGDDVKIDKMVLENLNDPLIHILRNCIDHGIEDAATRKTRGKPDIGKIRIDVSEENRQILIKISDDGAGIDVKKITAVATKQNLAPAAEISKMTESQLFEFIFNPGFSTKDTVTDISGRGVGLDVVKSNIQNLSGQVAFTTELGKSTTCELRVPLTLATERGLVINCGGHQFVVPTQTIQRVLTVRLEDILLVEGCQAVMLDNKPISLHALTDVLGLERNELPHQNRLSAFVLKQGHHQVAILVDDIVGEREIVIKPLSAPLTHIPCVAGGTLSANNQAMIVLESNELINAALHINQSRQLPHQENSHTAPTRPHVLVVDDSITTRTLEKNILETKNYLVTTAVNGKEAWDILQKQKFSLLITDVSMPIMDGFTLTAQVKKSEKLANMPVIIVTSLGSDMEKKRGIDVGADAYIIKNEFESGSLLNIVEQLVVS